MKTKSFDCVEMKRLGAERVQKELVGLTPQEQLEYWRQQTEELRERVAGANINPPQPSTHA
jgi:hypothetical protein